MLQTYLEAGKIVGTHGIQGELKVDPWCDSPAFLKSFRTLYRKQGEQFVPVKVVASRVHKNQLLVKLEGVTSIEEGDVLRGKMLYLHREDAKLPEGRYFIADLIGMEVRDADTDRYYGKVTEVFKTGANDVYQITDEQGKHHLFPVVAHMVEETDILGRRLTIRPIKGIFDDAD